MPNNEYIFLAINGILILRFNGEIVCKMGKTSCATHDLNVQTDRLN